MDFELTRRFLGSSVLGLFGAGHLGRSIATGLVKAGFPERNLAICHRGAEETSRELAGLGFSGLVYTREHVVRVSKILFYLVRPQNYTVLRDFSLRNDCLLVSFLAGIPLKNLTAGIAGTHCVRVMTSAPDTLFQRKGIAALYPGDNPVIRELLESLDLRLIPLKRESDFHAFTALGPCLPIALTYWESSGRKIDEPNLLELGSKFGLAGFDMILEWAQDVRPKKLLNEELRRYLDQATTPGGVTDAILSAMKNGLNLTDALERGIERSEELAAT